MLPRTPEPELMDLPHEALAYAQADFSAVNRAFVDRLLEILGEHKTLRLVDLGAGPADIPVLIAQDRPGWTIIAVDGAPAMLELARMQIDRQGLNDRVQLRLADAKQTGLPAGSFDVVYSNSILHHVSDPLAFWREVGRLTRTGGWIFLRDLTRPESEEEVQRIVQTYAATESQTLREEFARSLRAAYTPEQVVQQLKAASLRGLMVVRSSDRHLDVYGRR